MTRKYLGVLLAILLIGPSWASYGADVTRESPCGPLERFVERRAMSEMFRAANASLTIDFDPIPLAEKYTVRVSDGVVIVGYRLLCPRQDSLEKYGFLLIAQGNGMLASDRSSLDYFSGLCPLGVDIFLFDYRGTGGSASDGTPSLQEVVVDYLDIYRHLTTKYPASFVRYLYGISGGGVVLANALQKESPTALVLDSTPDILKVRCWHKNYRPSSKISGFQRILAISGKADEKVEPRESESLLAEVDGLGETALTVQLPHPDMDTQGEATKRHTLVMEFFTRMGDK